MTKTTYTCKFCQKPGVVEYDETVAEFDVSKWLMQIACNRCFKYHSERVTIEDRIAKICGNLMSAKGSSEFSASILPRAKGKLTELSKRYADNACDFINKKTVWEPDFVDMLVSSPHLCRKICSDYLRHIKYAI